MRGRRWWIGRGRGNAPSVNETDRGPPPGVARDVLCRRSIKASAGVIRQGQTLGKVAAGTVARGTRGRPVCSGDRRFPRVPRSLQPTLGVAGCRASLEGIGVELGNELRKRDEVVALHLFSGSGFARPRVGHCSEPADGRRRRARRSVAWQEPDGLSWRGRRPRAPLSGGGGGSSASQGGLLRTGATAERFVTVGLRGSARCQAGVRRTLEPVADAFMGPCPPPGVESHQLAPDPSMPSPAGRWACRGGARGAAGTIRFIRRTPPQGGTFRKHLPFAKPCHSGLCSFCH